MSSELVSGLLGAIVGGAISYYSSSWLYKKQIMQEAASLSAALSYEIELVLYGLGLYKDLLKRYAMR